MMVVNCSMESVYIVLTGIVIGSVFTVVGTILGAFSVNRTYSMVIEPPGYKVNMDRDAEYDVWACCILEKIL